MVDILKANKNNATTSSSILNYRNNNSTNQVDPNYLNQYLGLQSGLQWNSPYANTGVGPDEISWNRIPYEAAQGTTAFNNGAFGISAYGGKKTDSGNNRSGYGYPSYANQIAAIKAQGEQNLPLIFQQYNDALGDKIDTLNAAHDMGDQAIAQARDLYDKQNANQRGIVDDMWYYQTQKFQNSRMQHEDAINGQYGSIWQRLNDLYNIMDDQMDQTNFANLKQGLFQNGVEFQNTQNTTATNMVQNDIQTYNEIRDILRQGGSSLTNFANEILSQLSTYGDNTYRDTNGQITQAGWDYLAKYGIVNDGNGGFTFNYNLFSPNVDGTWGSGNLTMEEYLSGLKESRPTYFTVDHLPTIRKAHETTNYLRGQSTRNREEAVKNGKLSAVDYTDYITKRYG